MGCDIYWHVERQLDDGTWEYVPDTPEPDRWYELFSVLAGVRRNVGDPPQRFEPQREMPHDVSLGVRVRYGDGEGDFGLSYRTLSELLAHDWTMFDGGGFGEVLRAMAEVGPPDKVRAVFWFRS